MKRGVMFGIFMIFVISLSLVSAGLFNDFFDKFFGETGLSPGGCTDSDGGFEPYVKGTAVGGTSGTDVCFKDNQLSGIEPETDNNLFENYCNVEPPNAPSLIYCPNGCENGACLGDPSTLCEEEWKCISSSTIGYLSTDCSWIRKESCYTSCGNSQCDQNNLNYSAEILSADTTRFIYLDGDLVNISVSLQNHFNYPLEGINLYVDDSKGWMENYALNFGDYESKEYNIALETSALHTKYNPHDLLFGVENDLGEDSNRSRKIMVFDRDTLTILKEGETKNVVLEGKTYTVSISYLDSGRVNLLINGESANMNLGTFDPLSDGSYVGNFDIITQDYAGGLRQVTFALAPPGITATCTDQDGGKKYETKGETCFGVDCKQDTCNGLELTEYFCSGDEINSEIRECDQGEICSDGKCVDEDIECSDDFDCSIEGNSGPYCEGNSVCIEHATSECINPGAIGSYCDLGSVLDCTPCPNGCGNGGCISDNSCETTGIRENGQYCSQEKFWVTQKQSETVCENNFECRSNSCTSRSCQSITPEPNNLLQWILGILVGILIVSIIVFLIIKFKD